jgi:tetratricopeptide (TPR) repeat protein
MEKKDAAIDLLETELAAFRKALGEELQLPDSARTVLSTLTRFLQDRSRFADAEKHLKTELALVRSNQGKQFLLGELAGVYDAALNAGGTTSLGKGAELYAGARTMMIGWFKTAPRRSLYSPVGWICNLMGTAHRKGLPGVQKDLLAFAAEALAVSKFGESYEAHGIQSTVAASIRTIIGPARAIEFIIEAIEQEPAWYRWQNQGGYAYHVYSLGNWRADAGKLGPLEKRLEKVVLAALEEDLVSLYNRGCGSMTYECSDNVYWKEKREFFARTAEKVARENQGSPAIVEFAATYLHDGIKENARAIALLTGNLLKEGKLSPNARSLLGKWLVEAKRFKEAVPILEALVEKNPGMMSPRYDLMIAWAQLKQEAKLVALVAATEKYLRDDGLWAEGAIAGLALACQHALLHEQAATYFREAIAEHRRTRPAGGSGDGTLSDHYRRLAESLTVLGRTDEALEAGCGAVVSWGSSLVEGRRTALAGLNATLAKEKDLGTVVARLDSQVEQSGRENAVLRKAVGQVLLDRGKCDQAVMQLEKALEAQPYDLDSYDALVKAHECANDETAVVATMLRKAEVATRDLELFEKVARRMSRTARAGEAERAFTTIVEALPAESESHGALAVIREEQGRYPEAIEQWRHVVRIRSKEPPGYLSLAKALIHEKGWEEARSMLKTLLDGQWPAHFGDVKAEAATLLKKIPKKK